jgi:hypothetical protein
MAIKTFTTGEVLTASDTNTYLANAGLVYITQANLSGSAVNITSCFSATYDSYVLRFTNVKVNTAALIVGYQMLNGSTPLTTATYNAQRASLQAGVWNLTNAAGSTYGYTSVVGTDVGHGAELNIYQPFLTTSTMSVSQGIYSANLNLAYLELLTTTQTGATSFDGIRLIATGSTFATGKVIVYGMRQS